MDTVIGRLFWDKGHPSPWMLFRNITAFKTWQRDIRKARPGTKCEWHYVGRWTPEAMLYQVRNEGKAS